MGSYPACDEEEGARKLKRGVGEGRIAVCSQPTELFITLEGDIIL